MNNLKWFQTEEGQEWLASKEHYYWIEGGKRGIWLGILLGIPLGIVLCGSMVQFGLL